MRQNKDVGNGVFNFWVQLNGVDRLKHAGALQADVEQGRVNRYLHAYSYKKIAIPFCLPTLRLK